MNLHRFLAYTVLACWIALTAVLVGTALQWSAANAMTEVKVQRALNAQKEANARLASLPKRDLHAAPEDLKAIEEVQSANDRYVAKAEVASEAMSDALNSELVERKQFWWELGVWGCLTLLTSALLAEGRDGDDRVAAYK
jgi:uncharacterized membrane protein YdfJ with MMPL/SSD domain